MLFLVLLTVLGFVLNSAAEDVNGVVGDDVIFTLKLKPNSKALEAIVTRSDGVELGNWLGGKFVADNRYKGRLKFSYDDKETVTLTLMSTIESDFGQTYAWETHYTDGSSTVDNIYLHKQKTRTGKKSPGNRVEITQWCLFLPGLLYVMLENKGVTQVMVLSFIFLLVSNVSTVMAGSLTDDNCDVTWLNTTSTINNNNTLFMKWQFSTLENVTEVQFRRHNKITTETMATLTPVHRSTIDDDNRMQFNYFKYKTRQNQNGLKSISNLTPRDTEYDYDILVKLGSGCEIHGPQINGSEIRPSIPHLVTTGMKVTADHSEVIGQVGHNISMVWTYESDQKPQYILFKKLDLSSTKCECIGKLEGGEIENINKTQVLRHQKSSNDDRVTGLVTITLLNTTQQDYGAEYGLEIFNVSDVQSPYIEAKLLVCAISRSAIVSSQTLDIKLTIIMCSMFNLSLGWKS